VRLIAGRIVAAAQTHPQEFGNDDQACLKSLVQPGQLAMAM
jgi:hypothetical protein